MATRNARSQAPRGEQALMVPSIEVVVTDLDGTLWWGHEETHPSTTQAWSTLEHRGIPVLVATGRRITSTRTPLARLGLQPPAVVLNGALVLDLGTDQRFHRHHFTSADAATVLQAYRACDLEPCVYIEHPRLDAFFGSNPTTHPEHLRSFGETAEPADLDEVVATAPVFSFGMMGHDPEPLARVAGTLSGVAETHLGPDFYGGYSLTVAPVGLSKWVGVVAYCTHRGLDPDRVLAIGDGPNDRELLTNAAIAVAPETAHPDALTAADHTVSSPRDGGWAELLELF